MIVTFSRERGYPGLFVGEPHKDWYILATRILAHRMDKPCNVLDAGCGAGYGAYELWRMGHRVTAFDVDEEAVEFALTAHYHASPTIRYVHQGGPLWDAQFASVPDQVGLYVTQASLDDMGNAVRKRGPYDAILSIDSFEHVADDAKAAAELRSVANPDALLILSTPDAEKNTNMSAHHEREYTPDELQTLLEANGWKCTDLQRIQSHPVHMCMIARAV